MQPAENEAAIGAEADQFEALVAAGDKVRFAGGGDAAVFAGLCDGVFDGQQLFGDARAFPLSSMTGGAGIVTGPEEEQRDAIDLDQLANVLAAADRLDERYDEGVFVGLGDVLGRALAPGSGPLAADAADAGGRVFGECDALAELVGRFDPRDEDAVGPDVEGSLHKVDVAGRHTDEGDGVAADGCPQVLDDFFPIQMSVLGVDDDPIEANGDRHLGDAGAFERDPEAERWFASGQFLFQFGDRGSFHVLRILADWGSDGRWPRPRRNCEKG